jgi:release factor glutamine methyltransferase
MITAGDADFDGVVLTLRVAGCVFAEEEAALLIEAAASSDDLAGMVGERVSGRPLEHILGWVQFCGRRVFVAPAVFVPRRRTELIVREAIDWLDRELGENSGPVVVDLCCGCGAIGAAIAAARPIGELHAVDIEPRAVDCARRNVEPVGGQVYIGDLVEPLPSRLSGRIDILLANAPYVPTEAIALMPPEARDYEPTVALDGGTDGLAILRRVIDAAGVWLSPRGALFVETSESQASLLLDHVTSVDLIGRRVDSDELQATVVAVTRPGA